MHGSEKVPRLLPIEFSSNRPTSSRRPSSWFSKFKSLRLSTKYGTVIHFYFCSRHFKVVKHFWTDSPAHIFLSDFHVLSKSKNCACASPPLSFSFHSGFALGWRISVQQPAPLNVSFDYWVLTWHLFIQPKQNHPYVLSGILLGTLNISAFPADMATTASWHQWAWSRHLAASSGQRHCFNAAS